MQVGKETANKIHCTRLIFFLLHWISKSSNNFSLVGKKWMALHFHLLSICPLKLAFQLIWVKVPWLMILAVHWNCALTNHFFGCCANWCRFRRLYLPGQPSHKPITVYCISSKSPQRIHPIAPECTYCIKWKLLGPSAVYLSEKKLFVVQDFTIIFLVNSCTLVVWNKQHEWDPLFSQNFRHMMDFSIFQLWFNLFYGDQEGNNNCRQQES